MLIGITGYARAGKDTVGKILTSAPYNFVRVSFADPLKQMALDIDPLVAEGVHLQPYVEMWGWETAKEHPEVRRFLQRLGSEGIRKNVCKTFWLDKGITEATLLLERGFNVVMTDPRFPNEAQAIKQIGGEIWRVFRPGTEPINGHTSETSIDTISHDRSINNDGEILDLEVKIATMIPRRP